MRRQRLRVEMLDRHAEHVDPDVPLCEHETIDVWIGSKIHLRATMEMPGWLPTSKLVTAEAEIELELVSEDHLRMIVNHADYLAAKRALQGVD